MPRITFSCSSCSMALILMKFNVCLCWLQMIFQRLLHLYTRDGDSMFLFRNVDIYLRVHMASQPRTSTNYSWRLFLSNYLIFSTETLWVIRGELILCSFSFVCGFSCEAIYGRAKKFCVRRKFFGNRFTIIDSRTCASTADVAISNLDNY
jgi:hypothetical protein